MLDKLRQFGKNMPIFLTAFILAITVWVISVNESDPIEQNPYPRSVPIEVIGQDASLLITSDLPTSVSVVLSAPQSVWTDLNNDVNSVRAVIDLSGVGAGTTSVEVKVQVSKHPTEVISYSPGSVDVTLESLASRTLPINLVINGEAAIGYQSDDPVMSNGETVVTGPSTVVSKIQQIRAVLDLNQAHENITKSINLEALDINGSVVKNVTLSPDKVTVTQTISQKYGYRNVVVNLVVEGEISPGYRLTNISVFPPAVTVYSPNPQIVNDLPGYIETMPLNLSEIKDDIDIMLPLNLPESVSVVDDRTTVLVRLSVAAIESSRQMVDVPVEVIGLGPGLGADLAPMTVTVILSGPLPILDTLTNDSLKVTIDATDLKIGSYQLALSVEMLVQDIIVESIQPGLVDVAIKIAPTPTPVR